MYNHPPYKTLKKHLWQGIFLGQSLLKKFRIILLLINRLLIINLRSKLVNNQYCNSAIRLSHISNKYSLQPNTCSELMSLSKMGGR